MMMYLLSSKEGIRNNRKFKIMLEQPLLKMVKDFDRIIIE